MVLANPGMGRLLYSEEKLVCLPQRKDRNLPRAKKQ